MSDAPTINATPTRWVTAEVLRVLAGSTTRRPGDRFTGRWLAAGAATLTPTQRTHATTRLVGLGFVKHQVEVLAGERCDVYTITADGAAAIKAAAEGHMRKSGPKLARTPTPAAPGAMTTRLWALVRMRKIIDSEDAARTLCNAGEQEFERVRATVRKVLRRWELAGALVAGARRVQAGGQPVNSNGNKRYVLVKDTGPTPPHWACVMRVQAAQASAQASLPATATSSTKVRA